MTYAEASMSQKKEDFIESVENALRFFGGVPQGIVPDNLKSAVTKSNRYEPTLNETFLQFSEHY
jgi:transposase